MKGEVRSDPLADMCERRWPIGWCVVHDTRNHPNGEERALATYAGVEIHVRMDPTMYYVWSNQVPALRSAGIDLRQLLLEAHTTIYTWSTTKGELVRALGAVADEKEKLSSFRVRVVSSREVTVSADNIATVASWLMNRQGNELFSDPGDWVVQSIEVVPTQDTVEVFADGTWKENI